MKHSKTVKRKLDKKKVTKALIIVLALIIIGVILYQINNNIVFDKNKNINLVINNKNITSNLKKDIFIQDDEIYISKQDLGNFFDKYIYEDTQNNQIITTYDTKIAAISLEENKISINGVSKKTYAQTIKKDDTIYLPIKELEDVYGIEISYIENSKVITIDSTSKEQKKAIVTKNLPVKSTKNFIAKTVDKIKKGSYVVVISEDKGYTKVRTENGKLGYIKSKYLANEVTVRENMEETKQIEGKVNLVWDYYSEYAKAPNRSEENIEGVNVLSPSFFYLEKGSDGKISENVKQEGKDYIEWAHNNGFKVWPIVSNNSYLTTTEGILNDYTKRRKLEDEIIRVTEEYNIDGINLDFENMNQEDKDMYSRFVIELAPRLKDLGKTLTVDVTAPDGSETWSLCFDRDVLAKVSDYIVFMAYDQYGTGGNKEGTTAGYNWVENNVNKFIGQEAVAKEKIILGIPLYTRLWKEDGGKITSKVVNIKDVESTLPSDIQKKWDEELKQNYVEYTDGSATYKMWIEDEKSITEKIGLAKKYDLAGIAFWEKDREYDGFWQFVANEYK